MSDIGKLVSIFEEVLVPKRISLGSATILLMLISCMRVLAAGDEFAGAVEKARLRSLSNLRHLHASIELYAAENRGHLPRDLDQMKLEEDGMGEILQSPFAEPGARGRFIYLLGAAKGQLAVDRPVAIDAAALDLDTVANVLFGDGRVQKMTGDELKELARRSAVAYPDDVRLEEVLAGPEAPEQDRVTRRQRFAERMGAAAKPAVPTQAFFSVDDGKTWFADDINRVPPFEKDGKVAYRAHVYRCAHGKTFVSHLERYTPEAKKVMEAAAEGVTTMADKAYQDAALKGAEVKKPLQTGWVNQLDFERAAAVTEIRCPEGTTEGVEPVYP